MFPKNMFYFFLNKLNYNLEKITPEGDTVQGSLKWPGPFFSCLPDSFLLSLASEVPVQMWLPWQQTDGIKLPM